MREVAENPMRSGCPAVGRGPWLQLRTLLLGSLLLASLLMGTSCALATNNRLRRSGVEAPASVTSVESTIVSVDDDPVLMISLMLEDEAGGSNAVARQVIPAAQVGELRPGRVVTVRHNPARPGKAVIVAFGHAHDEAEAHRILTDIQATQERLNTPGVGRPAEGVVMSIEELGITVNRIAKVFELRVLVVPEASADAPTPELPVESEPRFGLDEDVDRDGFGESDPYEVEQLDLGTPFDTNADDSNIKPHAPDASTAAPFEATVVAAIAKGREDRYGPGSRVRLLYDPANRTSVVFDGSKTPSCFSADDGRSQCEHGELVDERSTTDTTDDDKLLKQGRSMRRAGIPMAILGGAGTIAGWTLYGVSFRTRRQANELDPDDPEHDSLVSRGDMQRRAAIGTIVSASLVLAAGMLLTRIGSNRMKRARMSRGEIGFFPAPGGIGLRF